MPERSPMPTAESNAFRRKPLMERAGERFRAAPLAPHARDWLKRAYHSALMIQTIGRGLPCHLPEGEHVRVLPAHRSMSWNAIEYHAFRSALSPGAVALDVGANVGAYALLLGQWVGPDGRVFAFEPSPDVHDGLARHIALNRLDGVVAPILAAVGEHEGMARLVVSPTAGESRLAGAADAGAPTVSTATTSIDCFCARAGISPDFIKIDVEGWELSVLRGARETVAAHPDLALFVELHPSIWPVLGVTRQDVVQEIAGQGLRIEPLEPTHDIWAVEGVCVRLRRQ